MNVDSTRSIRLTAAQVDLLAAVARGEVYQRMGTSRQPTESRRDSGAGRDRKVSAAFAKLQEAGLVALSASPAWPSRYHQLWSLTPRGRQELAGRELGEATTQALEAGAQQRERYLVLAKATHAAAMELTRVANETGLDLSDHVHDEVSQFFHIVQTSLGTLESHLRTAAR